MESSEKLLKEKIINDYISLIDVDNLSKIDYHKIENELAVALGEKPAVQLAYEDDIKLNESGKEVERVNKIKSINIFYTYTDSEGLKFGKKIYIIA
jgi:hypothetical protein